MVERPAGSASLGAALFVLLAVLSVAAFGVTRAARSGDDLVNTVRLPKSLMPRGEPGRIRFNLAVSDSAVDVLIIDGDPGSDDQQVRALASGKDLPAGPQSFTWDGRADDGEPAPSGLYALEVILGEHGRDILPPGRIRVDPGRLPLVQAGGG